MRPIANNVAFALSFFICLSFFPLLNAAPNTILVTETCQKVRNRDLCLSCFTDEHASQDAADEAALALIAINVAANNGSDTAVYIKKTLSDRELLGPTDKKSFKYCTENYKSAMHELDDALAVMVSRDYKKVKTELTSAIDEANTCASVLNQHLVLFKKNDIFRQLCEIAFDIVNILAPN